MRKFVFDYDKVNTWVLKNVSNERQNDYYNFVLDIRDGVPFKYSKRKMYDVNGAVFIYKTLKNEIGDFIIDAPLLGMPLIFTFDRLGLDDDNKLNTDRVIELVKFCYKMEQCKYDVFSASAKFLSKTFNE